jgi:hypothetical protein
MRASQFIKEGVDSDAVNELDTYIMNNEDLYRRRFMPKEYVKEYGSTQDDVSNMFPKETRMQVARVISDRELENIKQGEYDAPQGTVS